MTVRTVFIDSNQRILLYRPTLLSYAMRRVPYIALRSEERTAIEKVEEQSHQGNQRSLESPPDSIPSAELVKLRRSSNILGGIVPQRSNGK
jgi:hypothetical protein